MFLRFLYIALDTIFLIACCEDTNLVNSTIFFYLPQPNNFMSVVAYYYIENEEEKNNK